MIGTTPTPADGTTISIPPMATRVPGWRWGIVWLLFFATLLNYMDRQALAGMQRYLLPEFVEDPSQRSRVYGEIQFAFGLSFALFQVVAGFLVDRFSIRWLYPLAIVTWSLAGMLTGLVPGGWLMALIGCRVLLGIGEAFNWPCAVATVRRVIPRESRGLANGIFHSGGSLGALLMPYLVLAFVVTTPGPQFGQGWRELFVVVGALGFLWVLAWVWLVRREAARLIDMPPVPEAHEAEETRGPLLGVFGQQIFWLAVGILIGINLTWHFYNTWFPRYLTEDVQVDGRSEQQILAAFYIAADLGSLSLGWLSRWLVRQGWTIERSRQLVLTFIAIVVLLGTLLAVLGDLPRLARCYSFCLVAAAIMGGFSVAFAGIQDAAGRHTAQILGIGGCLSWLCIALSSLFIGQYAAPGRYQALFLVVGLIPILVAILGWCWPQATHRPRTGPYVTDPNVTGLNVTNPRDETSSPGVHSPGGSSR